MGCEQWGNEILGTLLVELGWSPSQLTEGVNGLLGPGYVARSTASEWLHKDRVPRDPLPTVVAHVVSDALEREVAVASADPPPGLGPFPCRTSSAPATPTEQKVLNE